MLMIYFGRIKEKILQNSSQRSWMETNCSSDSTMVFVVDFVGQSTRRPMTSTVEIMMGADFAAENCFVGSGGEKTEMVN